MRDCGVLILLSVLLFAGGLLNYRPWRGYRPDWRVEFHWEPIRIAESLRETGTFANPFGALRTGKTAHTAPGFPFLLFLVLRTLGNSGPAAVVIQALPVVCLSLELALLPLIAGWFGFSLWTGVLAGILGIITKPGSEPQWEAHLAGLLCLLAAAMFCRWLRDNVTACAIIASFLAGALFHTQPVFAAPWLALVLLVARKRRLDGGVMALLVVPVILCMPWSLRNYREIHTPLIRDDLGLELYVSFNNCAPASFQESLDSFCIAKLHPNSSIREALDVKKLGENEYNQERLRMAIAWITSHPSASAKLVAQRSWLFWFPVTGGLSGYARQRPRYVLGHVVTLASLLGLYLCWKQRNPCLTLFIPWLVLFPAIYYVVQFTPRYRYPILWMSWLLAAHAASYGSKQLLTFLNSRGVGRAAFQLTRP